MKKIKHYVSLFLLFAVFLFTLACDKDDDFNQTNINKTVKQANTHTFDGLIFEEKPYSQITDTDLLNKISKIKNAKNKNKLTDRIFNNGFTIDTLNVLKISNAINTSYRFTVTLDSPIENTEAFLTIEKDLIANTVVAKLHKQLFFETPDAQGRETELTTELLEITEEDVTTLTNGRVIIVCHDEIIRIKHLCTKGGNHNPGDSNCVASTGEEGAAYYTYEVLRVCDYIYSYNTNNSQTSMPTNGITINANINLSSTGFTTIDNYVDFSNYMGWSTQEGNIEPRRDWWLEENNTAIRNILALLYNHNTSATELNNLIDSFITSGYTSTNITANNLDVYTSTYLINNNYSTQSQQNVTEVLTFASQNVNDTRAQNFAVQAINALQINSALDFDEALVYIGIYIVNFSNSFKVDPAKELECFDLTAPAKLTIYVQQPNENTEDIVGSNQVGHAFVGLEQNGVVRQLGFYPQSGSNRALVAVGANYTSEIRTNNDYLYHVSISKNITNVQLTTIVNSIINSTTITYNVNNYACTDFAIEIGNLGGMSLPSTTMNNFTFSGRSPGKLGQEIRAMPSNSIITISTTRSNSPNSQGVCN